MTTPIEQILGENPELMNRAPMPTAEDMLARIEEIEKTKLPHCEKMYNYWMQLAARGERAAHKSAKIWEDAHAEYTRELNALYAKLEEATK